VTALRRITFPLALAWARLTRRAERVVLVTLGIAAGAALLAAVLAGSLVAQDRSVERATARVPATDRTVRLVWGGIASGTGNDLGELDRTARRVLAPIAPQPARAMLFRQSIANGHLFDLGAVDGLGRFVHVQSGRLPRTCRPDRCEVLQLGGAGPIPDLEGLRLVRVGRATLDSAVPLGDLITRETYASVLSSSLLYHTAATPPLLLAEGVDALASNEFFAPTFRAYSWAAPIDPAQVHPWSIDDFADNVVQARSELSSISLAFDLTAPLSALQSADETGRIAARRLLLIGGEAAALLLAFAVLVASGLRLDSEAQWRRLTWYGARRWQLFVGSAAEAGALALVGAAAGWAVGSLIGLIVANRAGVPAGEVLRHSVIAGRGFVLAVAIAAAAAMVVLLALRAGGARLGGLTVTPVDAAAIGAAVAVVIALARGAADANALAGESGTGAVLLVLPALIVFVAAVLWARALAPSLRLLERWGRGGVVPVRLAALSVARNPGRAAIAVAFLVVSLGLALFAEAYRSTLTQGQKDQAAYAVPVDAIVREDVTKLVPVKQAASPDQIRARAPGTHAIAVTRLSGNVRRLETSSGFTLLGIPADAIPALRWRGDYSTTSKSELADRLQPPGSVALAGVRLPSSAKRLELPVRANGDDLGVRAIVITPEGAARGISLGTTSAPHPGAIPADARGGLLVSLIFDLTGTGLHGVPNGGANAAAVAEGTMTLGRPRVDDHSLPLGLGTWSGSGGITAEGGARFRYLVTGDNVARLRARQPTDDHPVPVAVSPSLAAAAGPGGILPLDIGGTRIVGKVVATTHRVPTVSGDAVLADGPTLSNALDAEAPGRGVANELWLDAPNPDRLDAVLGAPPFTALDVTTYDAVLDDLRSEPLARGTLITLAGAALAALGLALVGLLLGVVSDLRDERGELFDLEAQGAEPKTLRQHLRLRSALVAGFGLIGGVVTGALLAALIVSLVTLTASAGAAEPPLLLGVDWAVLLIGLVVYAALAALLVGVATRTAFRADVAGRFAEVGT
jgi:FtsX-like permease family